MAKTSKPSLAETHPELAAQADGWDPKSISAGSNKKMDWICKQGHKYIQPVDKRTNRGDGCPYCSGKSVLVGFNDVASLLPKLANEADGWNPKQYTSGSGKKLPWKCELGHSWDARINQRKDGNGCPYCSGHKVLAGFNDLKTKNPVLANQAEGFDPSTVTPMSSKRFSWRCKHGHTWAAIISDRSRGFGCPYCAGQKVMKGFNDLATVEPKIASEAYGWDPTTVTRSTDRKVQWKCKVGHRYLSRVSMRSRGNGCPVCVGKQIIVGVNDLATTDPIFAAQAYGWDPTTVTRGSNKKVKWKCVKGHITTTNVAAKISGHSICAVCSGKRVQSGFNDLRTSHPELANQAHGWNPTIVNAGSGKIVEWQCNLGHTWKAQISNRTKQKGTECPSCTGRRVEIGFNDLRTTHPEIAKQAKDWNASFVTKGSHSYREWTCQLGHNWKATVKDRVAGFGCPICANKQVLIGFNDLATLFPNVAAEAEGWNPATVTPYSGKKRQWKCERGHKWHALVSSRSQGRGCPTCAKSGFDPNASGWFYLIENDKIDFLQIGITNHPDNRLARHGRDGWESIEIRGPMEGHLTQKLETACLHALEKRGAILGHKARIEKFDGYTEAWTKKSLNVTSIKQILDWVYEDETKGNRGPV